MLSISRSFSLWIGLWIIAGRGFTQIHALPCPFLVFSYPHLDAGLAECGPNFTASTDPIQSLVRLGSAVHKFNATRSGASDALANSMTDAATVSFQVSNEAASDSSQISAVYAIIPFLFVAALIIACYFFGPSHYRRLFKSPDKEQPIGPGFGFDGLTKKQLQAVRLREEIHGKDGAWFIKLPEKPPSLVLKQVPPLSPVHLTEGWICGNRSWSESTGSFDSGKENPFSS